MRTFFYISSAVSLVLVLLWSLFWGPALYFLLIVIPYIALGIYDLTTAHNVLRLYPVIGHFRYMFEFIRPEIQQYFVATNLSGRPYNREMRDMVYRRAKNVVDTLPFGTQRDITDVGYTLAYHSLIPKVVAKETARVIVGGPDCKKTVCGFAFKYFGDEFWRPQQNGSDGIE